MPGPGHEVIGKEEREELLDLLDGGYFFRYGSAQDPHFRAKVYKFEQEFAAYLGAKHALAVNSGTSALFTALCGLGIGPGDEVIVPGYTFIASISSIVYAKAIPILAEIDETLNIDPDDVAKKISPRTKAIMAVHMLGNPARLAELKALARKHKLHLIEDTAQACGATYKGKFCGTIGEVGTFSFNIFKTISAGDGGMVVTDSDSLYERCFGVHDQGHKPHRQGVEVGKRSIIGLDFRMNELTAAVLRAQLRKIDAIKTHLHENKALFKKSISDIPGIRFREITDEAGECATLLTVIFPDKDSARNVAVKLGTKPVIDSGWHVYCNMENLLSKRSVDAVGCPFTCPYYKGPEPKYSKGMLPRTEDLLSRAVNISIGVSDGGLGASFGVTMRDGLDEVAKKADQFRATVKEVVK